MPSSVLSPVGCLLAVTVNVQNPVAVPESTGTLVVFGLGLTALLIFQRAVRRQLSTRE
jgi:hypothetical protein